VLDGFDELFEGEDDDEEEDFDFEDAWSGPRVPGPMNGKAA
jgi:hypothetical protein